MKLKMLKWLILAAVISLPLSAQWDIRLEIPSANSSNLPDALITGSTALQKGEFNMGKGYIVTGSKAIFDAGILSLDGSLEYSEFKSMGTMTQAQTLLASQIKQQGIGVSNHTKSFSIAPQNLKLSGAHGCVWELATGFPLSLSMPISQLAGSSHSMRVNLLRLLQHNPWLIF